MIYNLNMKKHIKSLTLWSLGFISGVLGYLYEVQWLYLVGVVLAILGILMMYAANKDKSLWKLLINLLAMTP